jgi:Zn-dependent protease with chaperone function
MLGMVYFYSLAFHLVMPIILSFLIKDSDESPQASTLSNIMEWQVWPAAPISGAYYGVWILAMGALVASVFIPRQMLARGAKDQVRGEGSTAPRAPTVGRVAIAFLVRAWLLELVTLAGFVFAFIQKVPGLVLPFAALGFLATLVLPPTRFHLTRFAASATLALAVLFIVGACVTIPETGRSQLVAIPDGYMNQMGDKAFADMKAQEKISKNPKINQIVREIGEKIARASDKNYDWEFVVFDSDEVNAFCLPGGKVGVYTGLLTVAKTNAGLATVMGHEVAHAVARHGAERATQSLIVSGTLLSMEQVIQDPKYRQLAMAALGVGVQFGLILPFSRSHESEADAIGLAYMARAGFEPEESVKLWARMAEGGKRPPEWLSTHPDPARRARDLASRMEKAREIYSRSAKVPTVALP